MLSQIQLAAVLYWPIVEARVITFDISPRQSKGKYYLYSYIHILPVEYTLSNRKGRSAKIEMGSKVGDFPLKDSINYWPCLMHCDFYTDCISKSLS
jgi:hypothetical protein